MVNDSSVGMSRASLLNEVFEQAVAEIAHDPTFVAVEVVKHASAHRRGSTALSVTIDREGGVDVALCTQVAGYINDALASFEELYTLEVESAGLERPLLRPGDYQRFAGKRVRIITTLTINGAKTHRGILGGVRGTSVMLTTDSGELPLPLDTIKSANLEYDPRADLTRDKKERKQHA